MTIVLAVMVGFLSVTMQAQSALESLDYDHLFPSCTLTLFATHENGKVRQQVNAIPARGQRLPIRNVRQRLGRP